jgi:AcrR family transcriptional regulator
VLRAAIDLADANGIDSLTMRKLGEELGVEAMSLYNHVANKDDILDGIQDLVVSEYELPPRQDDWKVALRQTAISAREVLLRHTWAASLQLSAPDAVGPARLQYMDSILGTLREAGFSVVMTHHAFHVLDIYVVGFTIQQINFPIEAEDLPDLAAQFLLGIPVDDYPYLVEHINHHIESAHYDEGDFEFGLDLILDGLEQLHPTA